MKGKIILIFALGFALVANDAHAATNSWKSVSSGKWETSANWSLGAAPSSSDAFDFITNATTKTVTIDATTTNSAGTLTISNLYLAGTATSTNTLFLNNAGTTTALQILGTTLTLDTNGVLVVNKSSILATNNFNSSLLVGKNGGNASLLITNGGAIFNGIAYIGSNTTATGNSVFVSGAGSIWNSGTNLLIIGYFGASNTLTIANGGVVSDEGAELGWNGSSSGNIVTVSGSGSVWSNLTGVLIGLGGAGNSLVISNGGEVFSGGNSANDYLGGGASSDSNTVTVTGPGSLWSDLSIQVGSTGVGNSLTISGGGAVIENDGLVGGGPSSSNNVVTVTGAGSLWNIIDILYVGYLGSRNSLTVTNGGVVNTGGQVSIGYASSSSNNFVTIASAGSVWQNNVLYVGYGGSSNGLTIAGGSAAAGSAFVSYSDPVNGIASNNVIQVNSGSLFVTNAAGSGALVVGRAGGKGSLILNGGSVTVNQLVLTNGVNSVFTFNGGTLTSSGTFVTNNQLFAVGDATDVAAFQLNGGVHSFADNLEIHNNATLSGCGTVTGNVVVDSGGRTLGSCGGTLNFTGIVTNNGNLAVANGTTVNFYGPMVNNGTIVTTGGAVYFFSTFQNNGTISPHPAQAVPPSLMVNAGIPDAIVKEDHSITIPIVANLGAGSSSNAVLTVTVTNIPSNVGTFSSPVGTYDALHGTWTITLAAGQNLSTTFTFTPKPFSDVDFGSMHATAVAFEPASATSAQAATDFDVITDAVAHPPIVIASGATTNRNFPLSINVSATLSNTAGSESITDYQISKVPTGFTLNHGTNLGGGVWDLTPAQIPGLTITATTNFSGAVSLTAAATESVTTISGQEVDYSDNSASASNNFTETWLAVAVPPTLSINNGNAVVVKEDQSITIPIVANLGAGSSVNAILTIMVTGITNTWGTFSSPVGTYNSAHGIWTITMAPGQNLSTTFMFTPAHFSDADLTNLHASATTFEPSTETSAQTTNVFTIVTDAVAHPPIITASGVTSNEDLALAINVSATVSNTTGSETITDCQISGVPAGFSLNQGSNLGGGVWDLTPSQIAGLTITATAHFTGTVTLAASAVETVTTISGQEVDFSDNSATSSVSFAETWLPAILASNSWTSATSGKWETAANWSLGNAPSSSDVFDLITNATTKIVTIDATTTNSASSLTINNLYIAGMANSANTLFLNNAGIATPLQILGRTLTLDTDGELVVNKSTILATNTNLLLTIGNAGGNASLIITNGGALFSGECYLGFNTSSSNNIAMVSGSGSVWSNSSNLFVGNGGAGNLLIITNGGSVVALNVFIGADPASVGNKAVIAGGSLVATNISEGSLVVGTLGGGVLVFDGGTITVNQLLLTNGANSVFTFNSGALSSGGTFVTNNQLFAVGDATDAATFQLNGGVHSFVNNLEIHNNATLTGCGTVTGNVVVDSGGAVLGSCGGTLNFTGILTNNGNLTAVNGTVLNFFGPVVNNGAIIATNGTVHFFSTLQNNGTIVPAQPATVTLGNLSQTYDGAAKTVSVTTMPAGLSVGVTYNGVTNAPIGAGSYIVIGTITDPNYTGSATNTLVISKATASVMLGNLSQIYDGAPESVSAVTTPPGLSVSVTYNGSTNLPVNVGSYDVIVSVVDSNYTGNASGTLVIGKANATVTLGNLSQTYDGTPKSVSVTTAPLGLTVNVTYNGVTTPPINAGTYVVIGTITDANYMGSATNMLMIGHNVATVTLGNLSQAYNGTPRSVSVSTVPSGLSVTITYNGLTTPPTNIGSYTVIGTVVDSNYTGSATNTLVIGQGTATVTLGDLSQTYNGTARNVSVSTTPSGLTVNVTYNGSATTPNNAGSYTVIGMVTDPNYVGSATNTLVISKAAATIMLGNLSQAFDGTPKSISVTTTPPGLSVNVIYNGVTNAPINMGSYAVSATVVDSNYMGNASGTLFVGQATASVILGNLSQSYDGFPKSVSVSTIPAGLSVDVTYNGLATAPSNVGSYTAIGTISDPNYTGRATNTFVITQGTATVTFDNLSQAFDGTPKNVSVATVPPGLTVNVTYNGVPDAPSAIGSYTVIGTITDPNYVGSATNTLVIFSTGTNIVWTSNSDGNWNDASNWTPQQVPGPRDTVTVNAGVTVALSSSATVSNFTFNGGTLTGIGPLTVRSAMTWSNGTILTPLLIASNATLDWVAGDLETALMITNEATMTVTNGQVTLGTENYQFNASNLVSVINNGSVLWTGTMFGYGEATIYNNGLWQSLGDDELVNEEGSNTFYNNGTLVKNGGSGQTSIGWYFQTTGAVNTVTGALQISNWIGTNTLNGVLNLAGNIDAPLTVASNAVLSWWNGDLEASLVITNGATLTVTNNSITLGEGNFQNNTTNLLPLINDGTVLWSATIFGFGSATIDNNGVWQSLGDAEMANDVGTNIFINNGTFTKLESSGETGIDWWLNSTGTITMTSGTLRVSHWIGTNTINDTVNLNGDEIDAPLTVTSNGVLNLLRGSIDAPVMVNSGAVLDWWSGDLEAPLVIAEGGTLAITNIISEISLAADNRNNNTTNPVPLINNGTVLWEGTTLGYGAATIYNNGLWQSLGDDDLVDEAGTNTFINNGTFEKTGGFGDTSIGWWWNTTGVVATVNTRIQISSWTGLNTLNGVLNFDGTIDAPLTVASNAVLNWLTGDLEATLTIANGATLILTNNAVSLAAANHFSDDPVPISLINNGTVLWMGFVSGFGDATIYNNSLWQSLGDDDLTSSAGTNTFVNNGTLEKTGGTRDTTIEWWLNTTGTITLTNGALQVIHWSGTNTVNNVVNLDASVIDAPVIVTSNAVLSFNGTIGSPVTVASNATLNWAGGDLEASLTVANGATLLLTNSVVELGLQNRQNSTTNPVPLINNGTVLWTGTILGYGGATIYNNGFWDSLSDDDLVNQAGTNTFINNGTLAKIGGTGDTLIDWWLNTTGDLTTTTGTFQVSHWFGTNTVDDIVNLNGSLIDAPLTVTSNGVLNWLTGTIAAPVTVASNAVLDWLGGDLEAPLLIENGGTLIVTNTTVTLAYDNYLYNISSNPVPLINNGSVLWTGSVIGFGGATIYNNGFWQSAGGDLLENYAGTNTFVNNGTFVKNGSPEETQIDWYLQTTGVVNTVSGALRIHNWIATNTLNGALNFDGTLTAPLTVASNAVLNWLSGDLEASLMITNGAVLIVTNIAAGQVFMGVNNFFNNPNPVPIPLFNSGTVQWSGILVGYGATIYNNGLWQSLGDDTLNSYTGSNAFINVGRFLKSGGINQTVLTWQINNTGTLDAQTGTITVDGGYDLTGGTLNVGINSLTAFGTIYFPNNALLSGANFSANLNDGYTPTNNDSFPLIAFNTVTGNFANYNLPAGIAWQVDYGASAFTLTALSGYNGSSVNDGIPDWWRQQYFGGTGLTTGHLNCATCDADGTGQNNLFKYVAGLDPTNPSSIFVVRITSVNGQPNQKNLIYNPIADGRTYRPEFATNLVSGAWVTVSPMGSPQTNGNQVTVTDLNATQTQKFYRINISLPLD